MNQMIKLHNTIKNLSSVVVFVCVQRGENSNFRID